MAEEVNLKSVDAMFATLIAESKSNHAALMTRLDGQDSELKEIKAGVKKTNGRVDKLEDESKARKVRYATLFSVASAAGAAIVWLAERALS